MRPVLMPLQPGLRMRGMSMIEILVALVVFSIGALAIAGLQIKALQARQIADVRGSAALILQDLADRMRGNPDGARDGNYLFDTQDYAVQRTTLDSMTGPLPIPNDCETTVCTAAQIAANDLMEWRNALSQQVPGGAGLVNGTSLTGYTITVAWFDKDWRDSSGNLSTSTTCAAPIASPGSLDALNADAMSFRNCCPNGLGNPVSNGVRCLSTVVRP